MIPLSSPSFLVLKLFIGNTSPLPLTTLFREQNPALGTKTLNDKMGVVDIKSSSQNPACRVGGHLGREVGEKVLTVMGKGQMETCLEL